MQLLDQGPAPGQFGQGFRVGGGAAADLFDLTKHEVCSIIAYSIQNTICCTLQPHLAFRSMMTVWF